MISLLFHFLCLMSSIISLVGNIKAPGALIQVPPGETGGIWPLGRYNVLERDQKLRCCILISRPVFLIQTNLNAVENSSGRD